MRKQERPDESGNRNRTLVIASLALLTAAGGWWYIQRPVDPEREMSQRFMAARMTADQEVLKPIEPIADPSPHQMDPGSNVIVDTQPANTLRRTATRARASAIP